MDDEEIQNLKNPQNPNAEHSEISTELFASYGFEPIELKTLSAEDYEEIKAFIKSTDCRHSN